MLKMIITDLDNTLLKYDKTISDYTIDVFRRARESGVLVAFATARSIESSQEYRILINPDGDIVTGGCLVYAGRQLLQSHYLPEPQGAALLAELCSHPQIKLVSARSLNERYANKPINGRSCVDFKSPLPEKLQHCSCRTDDGAFMESIAARYPDFSILHISGSDLYDINPRDATKFNGGKVLAQHFGIPLLDTQNPMTLEQSFFDAFYKSNLYTEIHEGISDMHCCSDGYLAEELQLETARNTRKK